MSRIPIASTAPAAGPAYRAAMLRRAPAALPAAAPSRPRAAKPKAAPIARKARPLRKASATRPARKARAVRRPVVAPTPWVAPPGTPTPMAVAARELATPLSYALISAIICETGPPPAVGPGTTPDGFEVFPAEPPPPGVDVFFPPGPELFPDDEFVLVQPPLVGPLLEPQLEPQLEPPVGPPVGPLVGPLVEPRVGPPVRPLVEPLVGPPFTLEPAAIPEPASWLLMILGFGLLGARLRVRSRASAMSGSPGRARPPG